MYLFFYPFIFLLFSFYFDSSYPHYLTINFIFPLILYIFSHTKKGYYSLSLSLSLSCFFFCGFFNFLYLYFMLSNFVFCRTLVDKIWVCVFKLFFFFFHCYIVYKNIMLLYSMTWITWCEYNHILGFARHLSSFIFLFSHLHE